MIVTKTKTPIKYPQNLIDNLNEMAAMQIPCFIYGECGKTEFIKLTSPNVRIYDSREISEPKNLGGFYAVLNNDIVYTSGILTDAMSLGHHICFKRIDYNPNLLSYLRPVIYDRRFITNKGIEITAHPNFRIFFTTTKLFEIRNVSFIGKIEFKFDDVLETFGFWKKNVIELFDVINANSGLKCVQEKGFECNKICLKEHFKCDCHLKDLLCSAHFRMFIELRETLFFSEPNANLDSNSFRLSLYQAFENIFLKHVSNELLVLLYINLPSISLPNMLLAKTIAVESALRSLILNIKKRTPTLLIGETGTGKTALIQYLCKNSSYFFGFDVDLKILNMSSDFDGSDLIGGYHSIDFDKKIRDLYARAKISLPKSNDKLFILKYLSENSIDNIRDEAKLFINLINKKVPFYYKKGILTEAMKTGSWILLDEINLCSKETLELIEAVLSKDEVILYESADFTPIKVHPNFMIFACMNPAGDFGKKNVESNVFNKIFYYDFSFSLKCIKSVVQSISKNQINNIDQIANFYYDLKRAIYEKKLTNNIEPLISGRTLSRAIKLMCRLEKKSDNIYSAVNLLFFTQLDIMSRSHALSLFKKNFPNLPLNIRTTDINEINGYIITPKIRINLFDVEMAISANLPILLQGDTSTGKTSMIIALAKKHCRKIIRINNHEHTESTDYIGNFVTTKNGIVFKEGPLLCAMRRGYWIILDEMNLAPSDVLEVLNRLLDDNRELYVPELDESVLPHENFRIFATQNINYSGRHGLAKSFRNRFIEIFFSEKDEAEITDILIKACRMPLCFVKIMITVYNSLKFQGSYNNFITLRDLFKWSKRGPATYYELFEIGLNIIYERQRSREDRELVRDLFVKSFEERMKIDKKDYWNVYCSSNRIFDFISNDYFFESCTRGLILTSSYMRLLDLIYKAWNNYEPVLIIGETGLGKTKICEAISSLYKLSLKSINMHNGIESSDFIGHSILDKNDIKWIDGPLVDSMINGDAFLIDEINLAEDSVLERLNSVLESSRTLYIAETSREIRAHDSFRIIATMNPSGDYGKRELSPALRSRFTEIYFELDKNEYETIFYEMISSLTIDKEYKEYFSNNFKLLKNITVRKIDLIYNHLTNLFASNNKKEELSLETLIGVDCLSSKEEIWNEALAILGHKVDIKEDLSENESQIRISPYYIQKKTGFNNLRYSFNTHTIKINLQRILRGLTLNKGLLLEGEPGSGKTSIIQNIARIAQIPVLRINLSEQTEMSDLVGNYLPVGNSIKFVESEMVKYIRNGYWIILDEINLCSQSVIEGLNSVLDHRKKLDVDGLSVIAHNNTKIFGTMNPYNQRNGRKILPKSFLDRFIVIKIDSYTESDIINVLKKLYGDNYFFDKNLSLRGNIMKNDLQSLKSTMPLFNIFDIQSFSPRSYEFDDMNNGRIENIKFKYIDLPNEYVLVHSQLEQISMILNCFAKNIPIILKGTIGKSSMLRFLQNLFDLKLVCINCHYETDICDLLGQYQKSECSDRLFEWKDSLLIRSLPEKSLIIFETPELVEKCIFDRLNGLFECEKEINIYEKGFDTCIKINENCRFVLSCENPTALSPALLDRCYCIELNDTYSYIDLYKIFSTINPKITLSKPEKVKKFCSSNSIDFFRNLACIQSDLNQCNLDYDIRRFRLYDKLPKYLNNRLSISNCLIESDINNIFKIETKEYLDFNKQLLANYKIISSYAVKMPSNLTEKTDLLLNKCNMISLIKSLNFDDFEYNNCKEIPFDLFSFKYYFLKTCNKRTIKDISDIAYFAKNISEIREIEKIEFDKSTFNTLLALDSDPLELIKNEIINEKIFKENLLLQDISDTAKSIYKYDTRYTKKLKDLINEYDELQNYYAKVLLKIESKLKRDFKKFKKIIETLDYCQYINDKKLRNFLEDFNDISDYYLLSIFDNRLNCQKCNKIFIEANKQHKSSGELSFNLIRFGTYDKCLKYEYSKYLYNLKMGIIQNPSQLIIESIAFEEPFMKCSILDYYEDEINDCIRQLIPNCTEARIIETRTTKISLGLDFISVLTAENFDLSLIPQSLLNLNIFATPEAIINEIQNIKLQNESKISALSEFEPDNNVKIIQKLNDIDIFLKNLYKMKTIFNFDRNYRYFQYFLFENLTQANLQKFFFESNVIEFVDRIFFAEEYLKMHFSLFLYNSILIYKAFEFEKLYSKKLRETNIKLLKEPNLYESTLNNFSDRFLSIPITSLLKISFEFPGCQNLHEMKALDIFYDIVPINLRESSNSLCECFVWAELTNSKYRSILSEKLSSTAALLPDYDKLTKEYILERFMSHIPNDHFNLSEICLAKILNTIINNANLGKYAETEVKNALSLFLLGLDYQFPPFLFFIFKFCDTFEDSDSLTEGIGLKSGHGENHIDDKNIKEEDIVDDVDNNIEDKLDNQGLDMANDGELHSVSNESASDDGVDASSNECLDSNSKDGGIDDRNVIDENEIADAKNEVEEEEFDVEDKDCNSETSSHSLSMDNPENEDSAKISGASEEGNDVVSESISGSAENSNNSQIYYNYDWKETLLNNNQTCENADSYDRKVEGGNYQEKDALKEGEGEEYIDGEGEIGKQGALGLQTVKFEEQPSDCSKLVNLLRIAFESNKQNKYKGDFKSGKKLNMKKLVPYIASNYQKDKIWMKRQKNDKRDYLLRIFIDNSKSMYDQNLINILSSVYYKINSAFSYLNLPVELYKFGSKLEQCTINDLTFEEDNTCIDWIEDFKDGINIVLTDGVFQNIGSVNNNFLVVMIDKGNVRKMSKVSVIDNKVFIEKYLDLFALKYCILQNIEDLEKTFVEALTGIIKDLI